MLVEDQTPKSVYSDESFVYLIIYNRFQIGLRKIHIYCRILMEIANIRRNDSLKKVERRSKQWKDRPIFLIKHQKPAFPDITKSIRKRLQILQYNKQLKNYFQSHYL